YTALSYAWGEEPGTGEIRVSGNLVTIMRNLCCALRRVRSSITCRTLWADAICIDQGNSTEKGHQVDLMAAIYDHAENVLVWLGDDRGCNIGSAFRLISEFNLHHDRNYRGTNWLQEVRAALKALFSRSWFTRVWVMQEVGLANAVIARCGDSQI
ncbi:heterokaryon incompatibility, partial [Thozetella sp. PMI_491]